MCLANKIKEVEEVKEKKSLLKCKVLEFLLKFTMVKWFLIMPRTQAYL